MTKQVSTIETEILIDVHQKTPKAILVTNRITDEVLSARRMLESGAQRLKCYRENSIVLIAPQEIVRIYSGNQKVYVQTLSGLYQLHERLYEIEKSLDSTVFLRISKSEIVNSRKILRLNIRLTGTVGIELEGGITSFVSRRFVARLKEHFEIGGNKG